MQSLAAIGLGGRLSTAWSVERALVGGTYAVLVSKTYQAQAAFPSSIVPSYVGRGTSGGFRGDGAEFASSRSQPRGQTRGILASLAAAVMALVVSAVPEEAVVAEVQKLREAAQHRAGPWRVLGAGGRLERAESAGTPVGQALRIDPSHLRLLHRMGAAPAAAFGGSADFGDTTEIWVAELSDAASCPGVEHVAVKMINTADDATDAQLMQQEIEVLCRASTRCHNVCRMYGVSCIGGRLCIVMKLYATSLDQLIRDQHGKLSPAQIQRYGADICKGLAELHEQNIIMQDLKPSNVLIDGLGNAVLADFGGASMGASRETCASAGPIGRGTPQYMAPESWAPEQGGGVTAKADVWSFACLCVELFTGRPPFRASSLAEIRTQLLRHQSRPLLPPNLPPQVETLLDRCFLHDAAARPSAGDCLAVFLSDWHAPRRD